MVTSGQHIRVENATECSDDVLRYRINVENERIVVRRFNDFKIFDRGLDKVRKKPSLPSEGLIGIRKRYDLSSFNESRRAGLESYLRQLCAGDARHLVLGTFLMDNAAKLRGKSPAELEPYSTAELKSLGLTALQLRAKGRTTKSLFDAGFSTAEVVMSHYGLSEEFAFREQVSLKGAMQDFGKEQILHSHCFSAQDLQQQGITVQELKEYEYMNSEILHAGFNVAELVEVFGKEYILEYSNHSAEELKQGGITAKELKERKFSDDEIMSASFNTEELFKAGYKLEEQLAFGKELSAEDAIRVFGEREVLQSHKFSADSLKQCGFTVQELKEHNYDDANILQAGFSVGELKQSGFSLQTLHKAMYSVQALREVFPDHEILHAGFAAGELNRAGFTCLQLFRENFKKQGQLAAGYAKEQLIKWQGPLGCLPYEGYKKMLGSSSPCKSLMIN